MGRKISASIFLPPIFLPNPRFMGRAGVKEKIHEASTRTSTQSERLPAVSPRVPPWLVLLPP